jgi:hypothetical protein
MDPEVKSLSRLWWIYVVAAGVSAGALIAVGEKSISPRLSYVSDLRASRTGSIPELSKSKEWISQVKTFNKYFLGKESAEWKNPPAAQVVSAEIATPLPIKEGLVTLSVTGPDEGLASRDYSLRVGFRTLLQDFSTPANVEVGPLLRDNNPVSFYLVTSGFFGSARTSFASIVPSSLAFDSPVTVDLPVLDTARTEVGHDHLHVHLQMRRLSPDRLAVNDRRMAPDEAMDIETKAITGTVSFDDLKIEDARLITPAGRYTTLIITGDKDPRNYVRCFRPDTGQQIGAYSDRFPLVAVAVNDHASVKVLVSVHDLGEKFNYRIVGLSANDVTTEAMLLWYVTRDLTPRDKEEEDNMPSLAEVDARAGWLMNVLGVKFPDEEVRNIKDSDVRQLVDHLRNLQTTNGQVP